MPYILAFFRHAPVLESDYAIRTVQEFLGHKDVKTTMGVRSLVDRLWVGLYSPYKPEARQTERNITLRNEKH
jgi:site-specific recombinase XerC